MEYLLLLPNILVEKVKLTLVDSRMNCRNFQTEKLFPNRVHVLRADMQVDIAG